MHEATLRFTLAPDVARAVVEALAPEAEQGPEGTTTTLRHDADGVHVAIEADDLSGLRAAIHSATRLLDAAVRTLA